MNFETIILILATLASGLIAGLFYAWTISVTPGLKRIGDEHYLRAFQAMNRAILNPVFFIFFFGLVILLPLLCYLNFSSPLSGRFWIITAATIIYMAGIMAVTIFGNVPMNNSLEVLHIESMNARDMSLFRDNFENTWNRLNMIRTISSAISFLLLILAFLQHNVDN